MKLKKMVALLLALMLAMSLLTACGKTDNTKSDGDGKVTVNENGEWMPSGSVTLLVGWDAGGGLDTLARALAPALGEYLGVDVVVNNMPGANGAVAVEYLLKAGHRSIAVLGGDRSLDLALGALGDAGRLAAAIAQVIELGAADGATTHDLDRVERRRVEREHALHAFAEADLAHGEARADAGPVVTGDADALVILDAGALAFDNADADAERVARTEFGDCALGGQFVDLLALEGLNQVHLFLPSSRCRAPEGDACETPPWRSYRSGRRSRVSLTAIACRHAAIFA